MKKIEDFLAEFRHLNIELWLEGADLRYKAPKGALTPELVAQLKERKPEVVEFLQQIKNSIHSPLSPIKLAPIKLASRDRNLPLSFAQQRLWLVDQITANSSVYNVAIAYRVTGRLDLEILTKSLNAIAQRHESLRTTFMVVDGQPIQCFGNSLAIAVPLINLEEMIASEQKSELQILADYETKTSFDLTQSPLLRLKVVRLDPNEHVLFLTMHHIICDGWSLDVFFRELGIIYEALGAGKTYALPPLSIQYADFATWQRQWLQGEVLTAQLAYWQKQLEDVNPLLQLATDRPRAVVQSYVGDRQILLLPKSLADGLKALSQSEGATLYMTLLSAFQTLIHRYTGQTDLLIGCPIANRNRAELENLIGFFVNTLALRANLAGNPTFRELLVQTKKVTLEAYAHQDLPFEKLVEELHLERDLSFNPLVQVTFALQSAPLLAIKLANLKLSPLADIKNTTVKFDLEVNLWEVPEGLVVDWGYNTDLFDPATIARMTQHFHTLLKAIVHNPDATIANLSILTTFEQQQILETWNTTKTSYPYSKGIAAIFEEQVKIRGEAIAAKFGEAEISYQQLNQRANQLANFLLAKGIEPEALIAICVEQSIEMIVGLIAIIKARAAYIPMDSSYPDDRLGMMLDDAQVQILITQQDQAERFNHLSNRLFNRLSNHHGCEIICVDRDWQEISKFSDQNPINQATGDSLAYVIYTSGSTGKPKGVEVEQRAISRLVINTNYINIEITDRIAQAANVAFDAATFEIWGALLNGAGIVGINKETALSPADLGLAIAQQGITTLFLTTALFNQIARQQPQAFAPLKHLLFGGEAVDAEAVRIVMAQGKPERLLHVYGPTENTTFSTWHLINGMVNGLDPQTSSIPIGKAIANTKTYILDHHHQIVAVGVVGELYVGGDGLARGYLNRPELTSEKFIANPYEPATRLYKTGDLAKYLADGSIEFIGRRDFQIKIRGFRIELGEIEAMLFQHPDLQKAIAVAKDDPLGNKTLIAYVVAKQDTELAPSQLRSFLKEKLPDYMVPSAFVIMDELPLTANGKVDKNALPIPDDQRSQLDVDFVMPQTAVEGLIAGVWQEVLQLSNVGIYDNFFEIGGNSLLLVQAYAKLQTLFGTQVSMVVLFRYPNIHALALYVSQNISQNINQTLCTEPPDPNRAESRKSRQDLIKQQRQNRLKSRS